MVQHILAKSRIVGKPVDIIEETALFFRGEVEPVGHFRLAEMEAAVQVCGRRGDLFQIIRVNGHNDPLVFLHVDLGEIVAFKLVDQEQVSVLDIVKAVVDEKLLPARDGVVDLVTVMDVHVHGFFVII